MEIYSFKTKLDFGKHESKTIQQLIDENDYAYLLWCLRNHYGVCFTVEVFNTIKDKNTASQEEINLAFEGNENQTKLLKERNILQLEVINLKKMLLIYKNESTSSYNSIERYKDYDQVKRNWLAEAAGTDDPDVMNDVYWNIE